MFFEHLLLEKQPSNFMFCWKNLCYVSSLSMQLSVWGRLHSLLSTRSMNKLTGTRMRRSGCRNRSDEIIHGFLVTLCFHKNTQQKRTIAIARKKNVFCETWLCCSVLQSVKQLLILSTQRKFGRVWKKYPGCGLFFTTFFLPPLRTQIQFFLVSLSFERVYFYFSGAFQPCA